MGYGQATLLYAIYIMPFVLTNPGEAINGFIADSPGAHSVFFNTPSGERKLPEYAYSQITTNLNYPSIYLHRLSINPYYFMPYSYLLVASKVSSSLIDLRSFYSS